MSGPTGKLKTVPGPAPFDPATVRAVAFDGYGTLFRFHDDEFKIAVSEILTDQRLDHPDHDEVHTTFVRAHGRAGPWGDRVSNDGKPDYDFMLGGPLPAWLSQWAIWRRQWELTFKALDLAGDTEEAADHLRDRLSVASSYPDARPTLERLAERGLTLGLHSDADEDFLQGALARGELRFSVTQSSETLRAYKPNRFVFNTLCSRLGCEPSTVLYVGDSLPTDVQGARHAGLRTAWVRRSERAYAERLPSPDVQIASLSDLVDLFTPS